LRTCTGCKLR